MSLLGNNITDIAWHKAGIMKPHVPAYSAPQQESAMAVLRQRSLELGALPKSDPESQSHKFPLREITDDQIKNISQLKLGLIFYIVKIMPNFFHSYKSGLSGSHQYINAALADSLCREWILQRRTAGINIGACEDDIRYGLENTRWPGRAQITTFSKFPSISWYLDGAHTPESLQVCIIHILICSEKLT